MAFEWKDKINGENGDDILAEDINSIAHEAIRLEKDKANNDLSNVDNDVFKEKISKSGFVGGAKNLRDGKPEKSLEGAASEENPAIALGESCISIGDGCISGCMGYYISAIDFNNKKIYLTDTKVTGLPTVGVGEVTALSVPYVYNVTAEPVKFSIINGLHYFLCGTIKAIENNVVTYNEDSLGFNGFVSATGIDGHTFCVPTQPTVGAVSFVTNAVSMGSGVISAGKGTFGAGRDLILADSYCANFGIGNTTVYGAFASGGYNDVLAQLAWAGGYKNSITGYQGFGFGQYLDIRRRGGVGFGYGLKVYSSKQFVRGKYNIPDGNETSDPLGSNFSLVYEDGKYADIVGNGTSDDDRSNAYTLDWQGNARFAGKAYVECEKGIGKGKELATKESVDNLNKSKGMVFKDKWNESTLPDTMLADKETPNYEVVGDTYKLEVESAINGYAHFMAGFSNRALYPKGYDYIFKAEYIKGDEYEYKQDQYDEFTKLFKILGIVDMNYVFTDVDTEITCNRYICFSGTGLENKTYDATLTSVHYSATTKALTFKGEWINAPTGTISGLSHPILTFSTDNIYNAYNPYVGYYKPIQKELNRFAKDKMVTYSLNCGWVDF